MKFRFQSHEHYDKKALFYFMNGGWTQRQDTFVSLSEDLREEEVADCNNFCFFFFFFFEDNLT